MNDIQWCEAVLEGKTSDGIFVRFKCRYRAKDVVVEMIERLNFAVAVGGDDVV